MSAITEPLEKKEVIWQGKKFEFSFGDKGIAREVWGEGHFAIGGKEEFWDYEEIDGDGYISLGLTEAGEREDYVGKSVSNDTISIIS